MSKRKTFYVIEKNTLDKVAQAHALILNNGVVGVNLNIAATLLDEAIREVAADTGRARAKEIREAVTQ